MRKENYMKRAFRFIYEYLTICGLAMASSLVYIIFIFPNSFAPAGLGGVATMIQHSFGINAGYLSFLINLPLIVAVFIWVDKEFAVKTFVYILVFSSMLVLLQEPFLDLSSFIYLTENGTSRLLGPLAAGIINGAILGFTFFANCSSGGTDLMAAIIHKFFPSYNFVWVGFVLNAIVAIVSFFVYDYEIEPVLLCILYSYFLSNVSDRMLKGSREAIKFEIITDHPEEISRDIITELGHSATMINAEGCYTHKKKNLLMCVINKDQMIMMKNILGRYPGSFASISGVSNTVGRFEGTREQNSAID